MCNSDQYSEQSLVGKIYPYHLYNFGCACELVTIHDHTREVLFKFHLKFWNTASIGIPVRRLLKVDRLLTGVTAQ